VGPAVIDFLDVNVMVARRSCKSSDIAYKVYVVSFMRPSIFEVPDVTYVAWVIEVPFFSMMYTGFAYPVIVTLTVDSVGSAITVADGLFITKYQYEPASTDEIRMNATTRYIIPDPWGLLTI
jgi:hypothetical protein